MVINNFFLSKEKDFSKILLVKTKTLCLPKKILVIMIFDLIIKDRQK